MGDMAGLASNLLYALAAIMFALAAAGFVHAFVTPKEKTVFAPAREPVRTPVPPKSIAWKQAPRKGARSNDRAPVVSGAYAIAVDKTFCRTAYGSVVSCQTACAGEALEERATALGPEVALSGDIAEHLRVHEVERATRATARVPSH